METKQNKRKLAERLKKIRDHYSWSAREFAEKIGIGLKGSVISASCFI